MILYFEYLHIDWNLTFYQSGRGLSTSGRAVQELYLSWTIAHLRSIAYNVRRTIQAEWHQQHSTEWQRFGARLYGSYPNQLFTSHLGSTFISMPFGVLLKCVQGQVQLPWDLPESWSKRFSKWPFSIQFITYKQSISEFQIWPFVGLLW